MAIGEQWQVLGFCSPMTPVASRYYEVQVDLVRD